MGSAPKTEIETLLAPLTSTTSAWRFVAREILAYSDYRAGAMQQAQSEYEALAADSGASRALRARARAMATFMKAGGDKDFGTVPPPPAPVQPAAPKGQITP